MKKKRENRKESGKERKVRKSKLRGRSVRKRKKGIEEREEEGQRS